MNGRQRIAVFQQFGSGNKKTAGLAKFGFGRFELISVNIDETLPLVVDDTDEYLPEDIDADLVLDYLKHPDLSHDLAAICRAKSIPVVSSGKKHRMEGVYCPPTCCGLSGSDDLGLYGEFFGAPDFRVEALDNGCIRIEVLKGAPCGATHEAVARLGDPPAENASIRLGLGVQYHCTADPAGWDPINGKSPVHFAADVHKAALERAIRKKI